MLIARLSKISRPTATRSGSVGISSAAALRRPPCIAACLNAAIRMVSVATGLNPVREVSGRSQELVRAVRNAAAASSRMTLETDFMCIDHFLKVGGPCFDGLEAHLRQFLFAQSPLQQSLLV